MFVRVLFRNTSKKRINIRLFGRVVHKELCMIVMKNGRGMDYISTMYLYPLLKHEKTFSEQMITN